MSLAGLGLIVVMALSAWLYRPLPDNPDFKQLSKNQDRYTVEIIRDEWGVPHIKGKTDADTSFGLAYAHAEDDFKTTQETVAATRGVLARYRGRGAAPTDYVVNLMRVWSTLDAKYAQIPSDVKTIATAYADGLNLYAAHHPDQTWQGLAPFTAQDVIAGFMFKTPFFYGLDKELQALYSDDRKADIALAPTAAVPAFSVSKRVRGELGSNAIAVAAHRSTDDTTRLLINSHQPMSGPVAWYEAHLISDEGWDMTGGVFPGTPVILHGFNQNLGWANTVNHIDLVDTYVLDVNPKNPLQYRLDGEWRDFEVEEITLSIKLIGPFRVPVSRRILRSEHGPVISHNGRHIAVRYAGMGEVRQLEQYYRLNRSENLNEFTQAMSMNALPSINYVYADQMGNIGFIHNAQFPDRDNAWDWRKDLPGDRSDLIWRAYRPYSAVPKLINPQSGLIFNANNTPFNATDGADNLDPKQFPQSMGLAVDQTNRSRRLMELNDGVSRIDRDQLLLQKFDTRYSVDSKYVQIINTIMKQDWQHDQTLVEAQRHLAQWDRNTDIPNKHAALAITVLRKILRSDDPDGENLQGLESAVRLASDYLQRHYGQIDPTWGEVNRLKRGSVDVPIAGGPDVLRAIYAYGHDDDETPYATHGDTWIALVEWAPDGTQRAQLIHQFGSATSDSSSPHYADQAPMFAQEQWRDAHLDWNTLQKNAARRYRPQELSSRPQELGLEP